MTRKAQLSSNHGPIASRTTSLAGQNSTQSLFKPNPNFATTKIRKAGRKESPQAQQVLDNSPGDCSSRINAAQKVDSMLHRLDSKPTSCLMVTQNHSLNHFQDVLNSSQSLLKSISRDDDSAQLQLQ